MTTKPLALLAVLAAVVLQASSARPTSAQSYPSRPITLIVPFPAGGPTDLVARLVAERMKGVLGQPIVVENQGGANGVIGVTRALRAAPDGYTLHMGIWGTHVVNGAVYPLTYDPIADIEPVSLLVTFPLMLFARKDFPAADVKELIAWLKANPDKASQGTTTAGTHAVGALFQQVTGTRFQFVPYRGGAPAIQDLMAGHIDLVWDSPPHLPHVRSGAIKAYTVTAKGRLASDPNIPTAEEAGLASLSFNFWFAVFAPKGTPRVIIERLNGAISQALDDTALQKRVGDIALTVAPPEQRAPEVLGSLVRTEIEKWWPIIKAANIRGE